MKGFRNRILLPLVIPVGATVFFVIVVFNFSRILLLLEERKSAAVATLLAIVAASAVLAGFAWFATRAQSRTAGMSVFACTGLVLVFAGGYSFGAAGEGHEEEEKAPQGGEVNLSGTEFAFDPEEATVPAGPVTINLTNKGKVVHTFVLEEVPALAKISAPKAGVGTGTVDLVPGKYVYFCDETGHRGGGMEGTLTVTEGGGPAKVPAGSSTEIAGAEFAFTPKDVTVPSGPVKITLKNEGKVVHTIAFETVPAFVKLSAPKGGTATGTLEAAPGKYVFFCDEKGHRGGGMEGTLTVTGGGGGGGGGGSGGGKKPAGTTKDVVGKEFAFEPKEISVPAGPVTFNLKNEGKVVHTLLIDGKPEFATLKAPKGGTATGTLDIGPGTYTFYCNETGHRGGGMEGTLTVE